MALLIPTEGVDLQQDLEVTIASVPFILRFQWSERTTRWSLDFLQADETPVLSGRVVIPNRPLADRFTAPNLPDGRFVAVRRDGTDTPFGRDEIATEALLVFIPEAEFETLRPAASDDFGTLTFEAVP